MRTPLFHLQHVLDAFQRKKVLTKQEILHRAAAQHDGLAIAQPAWLFHQLQ